MGALRTVCRAARGTTEGALRATRLVVRGSVVVPGARRVATPFVRGSVMVLGARRVTTRFVRGVTVVLRVVVALPVRGVARRTTARGATVRGAVALRGATTLLLARGAGTLALRGAPLAFGEALARPGSGAWEKLCEAVRHRLNRVAAKMTETVRTGRGTSLMGISGSQPALCLLDERPEDQH